MKRIFWRIIELSVRSIISIYKTLFKPKWILSEDELKTMYRHFYISGKIGFHITYEDFKSALISSKNNPRFKEYGKSYIIPHTKAFFEAINNISSTNKN